MDAKEEAKKTIFTEPIKLLIRLLLSVPLLPLLALIPQAEDRIGKILNFHQLLIITAIVTTIALMLTGYLFYLKRSIRTWTLVSDKYHLNEIVEGLFVYTLKPELKDTEVNHWLCTNCFEAKQPSTLQGGIRTEHGKIYFCPKCKNEFLDHTQATDSSGFVGVLPEVGRW